MDTALYDGLNRGGIDTGRLRGVLAGLPLPRFESGRLVLAVDVSPWLRSDAPCSAERLFCHVYGRAKSASQFIPGWPYSFVVVLEPGRTSWTAILDAVRLGPVDDATAVTADQLRGVVEQLITAGQWKPGDPDITIVADAGYDVTRLAWVLRDLPVELVGRIRSDRVMRLPKPPRMHGVNGRSPKHGPEFRFARPETWPEPAIHHRDAARRNGTTTFAVTLAALLDPLRRIADTGGSFALAVADRDETADADAAGYFLTTVPFGPLPENGHDRPAWASDALRRAGEVIAEARTLAEIPFPSLMAELGLRDARPIAPLVVAWHPDPAATLSVPGCAVRSLDVAPLAARWPWTVLLTDRGELGLSGRIEFPRGAPGTLVTDFGLRLESTLDAFVRAL